MVGFPTVLLILSSQEFGVTKAGTLVSWSKEVSRVGCGGSWGLSETGPTFLLFLATREWFTGVVGSGGVSQCGGAVPGGSREVAVGRGLPHLTQPRLWPLDLSCSCQEANSPCSGLGQASLLHGLTLGQ